MALSNSGHALNKDVRGWDVAFSFDPLIFMGSSPVSAANMAHYLRCQGGALISKVAIWVGVSSGNICVGVLEGLTGASGPTSLTRTTGSIPCPAAGYAEVVLKDVGLLGPATVTVNARQSWFGISADNTTATFGRVGAPSQNNNFGVGLAYNQANAFPLSAPTALGASWYAGFIFKGVA